MDDLAEVVTSALPQAKQPAAPASSTKISPSVQAGRDSERLRILRQELSKATNPEEIATLNREISRTTGSVSKASAPAVGGGQFDDLSNVVSGAVSSGQPDTRAPGVTNFTPRVATLPGKTPITSTEEPGAITSFGAGAGAAFGKGVLAVQQLAGKALSYGGELAHEKSVSDLVPGGYKKNTLENIGDWLQRDALEGVQKLNQENAPYQKVHPTANMAGEVTGVVVSPVNKLVPFSKGGSLTGTVVKGALSGAALNALTTPVEGNDDFLTAKAKQLGAGGVAGGLGTLAGAGLSSMLNKGISTLKTGASKLVSGNPEKAAEDLVSKTFSAQGINPTDVPPGLFDWLKQQVSTAIKTTGKVDPEALTRLTRAQTLPIPVPMLQGQISRDAMQFAKEQNLRGIQGVGEPITQTLQAQNKALVANLDAMGASGGQDIVSAGKSAIDSLQSFDSKLKQGVTSAYDAFKSHTGKNLDVPLQGLAQDYANAVKSYGDAIPSAIRKQFESLGLMKGTQAKTFSIEDAESLIKDINRNYDPKMTAQAHALDDLRRSVQNAITEGAGSGQAGEAGKLAMQAREAAKARFDLIDKTPGLKDAISGVEPDKFIQKNILQGNVSQIKSMTDVLQKESPEALASLQSSIMGHIRSQVTNNANGGNEIFSQAKLKNFVNNPNVSARLEAVLGKDRMAQLKQLNQVAEDALYAPKASAVNTSNTASAGANLVQEAVSGGVLNRLYDIAKAVPGLSTAANTLQQGNKATRASTLINEAVNPSLSKQGTGTNVFDLAKLGTKAGVAEQQQKRARQ